MNGLKWFRVGFGVLWTVIAVGILWSGPGAGFPPVIKYAFPLVGVLVILHALFSKQDMRGMVLEHQRREREFHGIEEPPAVARGEFDLKCPSCGAVAAGGDVSPEGSAKCRSCGNWFKARRPG